MGKVILQRLETLTSPANPLLKDLRRAASRGEATADGLWIAEGFHLLDEAMRSGCEVPVVLISESAQARVRPDAGGRQIVLPDRLFQTIATTETTQGAMALVRPPQWRAEQLFEAQSLVVALDGLQDPGNAGAIVRAAEAFGATGVMFLKGSASPFHPKTLRASAGSLFRVPFVGGIDVSTAVDLLREQRVEVHAAMPHGRPAQLADLTRRCALVVGNEGRGVSPELQTIAQALSIPTQGVESLNAAVAAAVLLYEVRRQRA